MKEYNLGIANTRKILLVAGLTILSVPTISLFIFWINVNFLKENTLIALFFILILPLSIMTVYLLSQKYKDTFIVSSVGIETRNFGIIQWNEIENCSWESFRGHISVSIKLKNSTRLSIGASVLTDYSKGYDELRSFFNEIQQARENLEENDKFEISEDKVSNLFNFVFIVIFLVLLITLIVFNLKYSG
jgi:hypothetical protein